jgi:hypothetical protein
MDTDSYATALSGLTDADRAAIEGIWKSEVQTLGPGLLATFAEHRIADLHDEGADLDLAALGDGDVAQLIGFVRGLGATTDGVREYRLTLIRKLALECGQRERENAFPYG